jgi:DNA-binding NarL/FixJ family response regulator
MQALIADDHPMMRQGLAQLVNHEPDLRVRWEAATAAEALRVVTAEQPDLALVSLSLPDKTGLELIKDLHALKPELPILVVSRHDEMIFAERVLRAGARGYIMKHEDGSRVMQAIRRILGGAIWVSEPVSRNILEVFSGHRPASHRSPLERLSDREFEVFQLMGQGNSTREIAARLHLSPKTVEIHRLHLKHKLQVRTMSELVLQAVRWMEADGAGTRG